MRYAAVTVFLSMVILGDFFSGLTVLHMPPDFRDGWSSVSPLAFVGGCLYFAVDLVAHWFLRWNETEAVDRSSDKHDT